MVNCEVTSENASILLLCQVARVELCWQGLAARASI